jgi:aminoglycoside 6'-N-acetyltransferase
MNPPELPPPPPAITGARLSLRLITAADREPLAAILAEPGVAIWWSPRGAEVAADGLYEEGEVVYVIEVDGAPVGVIEFGEEKDPDYRHASIDIFLGAAHQGRGLGGESIRLLARHLLEERGHHRITIDPAVANERAIRAYERVGFRRVGVMRGYERGADGTWHDGLLMDMLAGELTEGTG